MGRIRLGSKVEKFCSVHCKVCTEQSWVIYSRFPKPICWKNRRAGSSSDLCTRMTSTHTRQIAWTRSIAHSWFLSSVLWWSTFSSKQTRDYQDILASVWKEKVSCSPLCRQREKLENVTERFRRKKKKPGLLSAKASLIIPWDLWFVIFDPFGLAVQNSPAFKTVHFATGSTHLNAKYWSGNSLIFKLEVKGQFLKTCWTCTFCNLCKAWVIWFPLLWKPQSNVKFIETFRHQRVESPTSGSSTSVHCLRVT